MVKPLFFYIALRYIRAKRTTHFISFLSTSAMIGIALGVMVLITVLSVMNGFDEQIKNRIFGMARQIKVVKLDSQFKEWPKLQAQFQQLDHVTRVAPMVSGEAMLTGNNEHVQGVLLQGIVPAEEAKLTAIADNYMMGQLSDLKPGEFGVHIGHELAMKLGVIVGDSINVFIPKATITPMGVVPNFKRFKVTGIFSVGSGFGYDSRLAFVHIRDAQKLYRLGDAVTDLVLKLDDLYQAQTVANEIAKNISREFFISTWRHEFGALFDAIALEKTIMFFILFLIICVAVVNLVSGLVMLVNDKRGDIAILRTQGATPSVIQAVFMTQGSLVGLMGIGFGTVFGILLSLNVTELVQSIEKILGVEFLSSNIYYVNYLPSKLMVTDVLKVCSAALLLSVFATLYPAMKAARMQPAEALRYE